MSISNLAQDKEAGKGAQSTCSKERFVLPQSIFVGTALEDFVRIASLPVDERRAYFSKLSDADKALFIKLNLALQLVKRPNMTPGQRAFVLATIEKVDPQLYARSGLESESSRRQKSLDVENEAMGLFSRRDLGDFLEPLGMDKSREIALIRSYLNVLEEGTLARMQVVKQMSPEHRANIWKTQLAYHLATGAFSSTQREFTVEMIATLSPEIFAARPSEAEGKALMARMSKVFTKHEAFAIFMSIGVHRPAPQKPTETENPGDRCQCLASCPPGYYCGTEWGCVSTPDGCGPFGWLGCHYWCFAD